MSTTLPIIEIHKGGYSKVHNDYLIPYFRIGRFVWVLTEYSETAQWAWLYRSKCKHLIYRLWWIKP